MTAGDLAILVNLFGYLCGVSLYGMLLVVLLQQSRRTSSGLAALPSIAAGLGVLWNVTGMLTDGLRGLGRPETASAFDVIGFGALGFLPVVVMHSALGAPAVRAARPARVAVGLGYAVAGLVALLHVHAAMIGAPTPSPMALEVATGAYGVLLAVFLWVARPLATMQTVVLSTLAVFAVTALHWSHHGGPESWLAVVLGHHASLPLVLAILYQDYRFAFADRFLKRGLALGTLAVITLVLYVLMDEALHGGAAGRGVDSGSTMGFMILWLGTVLSYPSLLRLSDWFVDTVVLRRGDYAELRAEVARRIASHELPEAILGEVCDILAPALSARAVGWRTEGAADPPAVESATPGTFHSGPGTAPNDVEWERTSAKGLPALVTIPTTDRPRYTLTIGELAHGRRLLSDDFAMLEAVAFMVGRRIDVVRVAHERCRRQAREQELQALATEAELRELRAQVDPHFLFNALTTVASLMQSSPPKALDALMQLTMLLRGLLRRASNQFVTLGDELGLVESYLAIERARFEERLAVTIDAPSALRGVEVPHLVIQPLVENALKHGIARRREGGSVLVRAAIVDDRLQVVVRDTGAGAAADDIARGRRDGVGLDNITRRLAVHYGARAGLAITSVPGTGTTVELCLPVVRGALAEPVRP